LRLTLKLANGMWLVSDYAEGPTVDWHESEFAIAGIRWRRMNIETIVEGAWVEKPDLSKVDEIGWTELAPAATRGVIACGLDRSIRKAGEALIEAQTVPCRHRARRAEHPLRH
jgi:hypothetical protein